MMNDVTNAIAIIALNRIYKDKFNPRMVEILQMMIQSHEREMSTRNIADACGISIYSARNWLIKLQQQGLVNENKCARSSTWHLTLQD